MYTPTKKFTKSPTFPQLISHVSTAVYYFQNFTNTESYFADNSYKIVCWDLCFMSYGEMLSLLFSYITC